ncbi:MAG: hypothetical protein P8P29_06380 [Flavobacteriaceae bacterium]|nr:hypothetical protein [Flavobacteriaceae bacterium]
MTVKAIDDPSSLGWKFDPSTGRWLWDGSDGGSGGEDYDDTQIKADLAEETQARIDGDALLDLKVSATYTKPEADNKFQVKGDYLTEFTEADPTVPSHVKAITTADIDNWNNPPSDGGGGGAVDSVNGKTGAVTLNYGDVGAQVAGSYASSSHNHSGVYAPASHSHNYASSSHNHNGVYAPASHSHSEYASTSYAYSKAQSDSKYELKGAGGGSDTLQTVTNRGATTNKSITAPNYHIAGNGYTIGNPNGANVVHLSNTWYFKDENGNYPLQLQANLKAKFSAEVECTTLKTLSSATIGKAYGDKHRLTGDVYTGYSPTGSLPSNSTASPGTLFCGAGIIVGRNVTSASMGMENHIIWDLGTPTADKHAANVKWIKDHYGLGRHAIAETFREISNCVEEAKDFAEFKALLGAKREYLERDILSEEELQRCVDETRIDPDWKPPVFEREVTDD